MKNVEKKIALLLLFIVTSMNAQIGVGTKTPHPDAMLEVVATNKGILLPRVALTATTAVSPLSSHVAGMTVYNIATVGDVTPGYYYNDGSKWVKLATGLTAATPDATTTATGKIQLAGDLSGTADAPTVPGLLLKANTTDVDASLALKAPLASPEFTGAPKAPTATVGDNSTLVATTAFVSEAVTAAATPDATTIATGKIQLAGDLSGTADAPTVPGLLLKANTTDVDASLALKAPLVSPEFTGAPKAPTATVGDNSTLVATTAFVSEAVVTAATPDATTTATGKIQLAGDLSGTASAPSVANLAINTAKLADNAVTSAKIVDGTVATADLADGAITAAKLNAMSATTGQVLKFDGTVWAPAADAGLTTTTVSNAITAGELTTTVNGVDATAVTLPVADGSETKVDAGTNVTITGAGTTASPYVVNSAVNNLYNSNGTLTGSRVVTQGANNLAFTGTGRLGFGYQFPEAKMEIGLSGDASATDRLAIYSIGDNTAGIQTLLDNQPLTGYNYAGFANSLVLQPRVGAVGIGVTPSTNFHTIGGVRFQGLSGTGSRMVVADATGVLSTQAIQSASTSVVLNAGSFERAALTGDVTAAQNNNALTISNGAVTADKLATMGASSGQVLKYNGTSWAPAIDSAPLLSVTSPLIDNYTVQETDSVIYRNITAAATITFPPTLTAGKVFYLANTSMSFDWALAPAPINTGLTVLAAGSSLTVVTLGGGNIMVVSGY